MDGIIRTLQQIYGTHYLIVLEEEGEEMHVQNASTDCKMMDGLHA